MRFLTIAPLLLAALLLSPRAASAKTPAPASQKSVSLDVETADLHALAATIERQVGVGISVVDGDKPYRPVSVRLTYVPLSVAMKAVAASAGAKVTQDANGIYVFAPDASVLDATPIPAPTQVQLNTFFAELPPDQNQFVELSHPDQALLQMHEAGAGFSPALQVIATPDIPAAISISWPVLTERRSLSMHLIGTNTETTAVFLHITPRINSDHSITLSLSFDQSPASKAAVPGVPLITPLIAAHTARSGSITVFDVTGAFPSAYRVFLFVTPTLVSTDAANDGTINNKP